MGRYTQPPKPAVGSYEYYMNQIGGRAPTPMPGRSPGESRDLREGGWAWENANNDITLRKQDMEWAAKMASNFGSGNNASSGSGIQFGAGGGVPAGGGGFNFGSAANDIPSPSQTNYTNPYEARLNALLDNPDSISNTGAYKFRFNQGQQALERSAAARGMTGSGNTLAALLQYGQGQAAQAYGDERDALAGLVGQRNQFNLGLRGADTAAYAAQTGRAGTLGELALGGSRLGLDAQKAQADDYWAGQTYKLNQQKVNQTEPQGNTLKWGGMNPMQVDKRGFW